MSRSKNDPVRAASVKNTAKVLGVTEQHVREIAKHGAKTLEGEEVKKYYTAEYQRLKAVMQPAPVVPTV